MLQGIGGIIGRADGLHVRAQDERLGAEGVARQSGVADLPDLLAVLLGQGLRDAEVAEQLKVGPVVEGVADEKREGLRPLLPFLKPVCRARDVLLGNAVGAHLAPFVVVTAKKQVVSIAELVIVRDHLRLQVAVVVDDRQVLCVIVIEALRGF